MLCCSGNVPHATEIASTKCAGRVAWKRSKHDCGTPRECHAHEIHHPLRSQRSNPLHTPPPLDNHVKPTRKRGKNQKPEGSARAPGMSGRYRWHLEAKVVLWWCSVVSNRDTPRIVNMQTTTLPPPRKSCVVVVLCCVVLLCSVV